MNTLKKVGCLILILTLSLPCFARKRIEWQGHWQCKVKSIIPGFPVSAWVENNNKDLLLEFSTNLGTVEVTVTNSAGEVVYKQSVEAQPSVVISLEEEVRKGCSVIITDGENMIYGEI